MYNFDTKNYIKNIAQTPRENWQTLHQATLDDMWNDTTQIYTIKEQNALPFTDEYTEYEAWLSTVSDDLINYSKVYSDFVRLFYRDLNHKQNYKGQYYKLNLDGEHEETYICYDRMNLTTLTADFKCVRCNNVLTWIDEFGNIITLPCYLGTDITSTNNLISKGGIVPNMRMIILVQANEFTKSIVKNQRFMFEHSTAFKVEEINNFMQEQGTNGEVTCIKIYINYCAILPVDNIELNICDYYSVDYSVKINQENIEQTHGFTGNLTATIENLGQVVNDVPVIWKSTDTSVVKIDENGNYEIVGSNGKQADIICCLANNQDVSDKIKVTVVNSVVDNKVIIIDPDNITKLKENQTIIFNANVYNEGLLQSNIVTCIPTGADTKCYELTNIDNQFTLKIKRRSNVPLTLTFSAEDCADYVININLIGLL